MPVEVTVLIADAPQIPPLRAESPIRGSVLYFSETNLASALENIRAHHPKVVAVESAFAESAAGEIRKMVALDGHAGPKAINVQPEFLEWLSDPIKNGAGALFDFGCYGANLMTWLMDNQRPRTVTAITQQFQPDVYPRVDDEATIVLEYPTAQGIIQASWNWPFNRKDLEVYGRHGLAIATGGSGLRVGLPNEPEHAVTPEPRAADERDAISHLMAVVRNKRAPNGLSSLENNLIVTEILEAALESARTHTPVALTRDSRD